MYNTYTDIYYLNSVHIYICNEHIRILCIINMNNLVIYSDNLNK